MKILKKGVGKLPKIEKFRGECESCHCVVEATRDEVKTWVLDEQGEFYIAYRVYCPTIGCNNKYLQVYLVDNR